MNGSRPACAAVGLLLLVGGCDRSPTDEAPRHTIQLAGGPAAGDTIESTAAQPLTVRVADRNGQGIPDLAIRFRGLTYGHDAGALSALVALTGQGGQFREAVETMTQVDGGSAVQVRLGKLKGTGRVEVSLPSLRLADTLVFQVTAGKPVRFDFAPRDTAVYVGARYAIRVRLLDRVNNELTGFTAASSGGPISLVGTDVQANATGRGYVALEMGAVADTAWVSVVPRGTLGVYLGRRHTGEGTAISMLSIDGSHYRLLADYPNARFVSMGPSWTPDGSEIIYHYEGGIYTVDLTGNISLAVLPSVLPGPAELPRFSRDGAFLYLGASHDQGTGSGNIWRVSPDGASASGVTPRLLYREDGGPSPSPDRTRLVYHSQGSPDIHTWKIRVVDLLTGVVDALDIVGEGPRWSPTGDWIAFVQGEILMIMRPDGSGLRAVADAGVRFIPGIDWSPDGEWIAARLRPPLSVALVRVATGEVLPLPHTTDRMLSPTWRPTEFTSW